MNKEINKTQEELYEILKIPKKIQELKNEDFSFSMKNGELIFEILDSDFAYSLYCCDLLGYDYSKIKKISATDLMYKDRNSSNTIARQSAMFIKRLNLYRSTDSDCTRDYLCYVLMSYQDYLVEQIKDLNNLENPIQPGLFSLIYDKLKPEMKITVQENDEMYSGVLKEITVSRSFMGLQINLTLQMISNKGKIFVEHERYFSLPYVSEMKSVNDLLNVKMIDTNEMTSLTERGFKYRKYTENPNYCACNGFGYTFGFLGDSRNLINGRIMIDIENFREMNASLDDDWYDGIYDDDAKIVNITAENAWMCSPVVYGFYFDDKVWCRMKIENISDIVFAENSFNELMIKDTHKDIIIAALTNDMPSLDSISGKGNGKIFLLYGAAGTGKTMTAESVAEYLKKPLYFVSVGELGTDPKRLENNLSRIMKIASSWNAVVLFDEVDAFVTQRDSMNLERNAMTAVFLRLLERYTGIMFMTTNLRGNLDEAFLSRCTSSIEYNQLSCAVREMIWTSILKKAEKLNTLKVEQEVYDKVNLLAQNEINGRIIKNTVRLGYSMALSKNTDIKLSYLEDILKINSIA